MSTRKKFILTTNEANRNGRKILLEGLDITSFQKNPVMFVNHDTFMLPIGKWENIEFEYENEKPIRLVAEAVFDEQDEVAKEVQQKVANGFLKGVSIGYIVTEYDLEPIIQDEKVIDYLRVVKKADLHEASIVGTPANPNALLITEKFNLRTDKKENYLFFKDNLQNQKTMKISDTIKKWLGMFPTVDTVQTVEGGLHIAETDLHKMLTEVDKLKAEKDELATKLLQKETELQKAKDQITTTEKLLQQEKQRADDLEEQVALRTGKPKSNAQDTQPQTQTQVIKLHYNTPNDLD